jgi:prepilin-type N-terminal cleavage/methylation domain-containing protein/prepilin-type processing-associated H-X9-DG protein
MKRKGFTLIELLVVIAIIALLLSILMPGLSRAKEHAKRLVCGTHMKSLGVAIMMYAEQQDDELPMNFYQHKVYRRAAANAVAAYFLGGYDSAMHDASAQERLYDMLHGGDYAEPPSGVTNLGYLFSEGLLEDAAEVLYCDSSSNTNRYGYDAYGGKSDWPRGLGSGENAFSIRVSYSYLPQSRRERHPNPLLSDFPDAAYKLSELNPMCSVVVDLLNGEEMTHRRGNYYGVNMLFGDGSVAFKLDENNVVKDGGSLIGRSANGDPVPWRNALRILERR